MTRLVTTCCMLMACSSVAHADTIQFEVFGTNVGSSSTYIGTKYSTAGPVVGALDATGPMNGLTVLFHDNDNSGHASNGDTISVFGNDVGWFQVTRTAGAWEDGTFAITDLTLTLGNGADAKGHHIEDGAAIDWVYLSQNAIGGQNVFSGTGVANNLNSGIFNHVVLTETSPGEYDIEINLWAGLLSPDDAEAEFGSANPFPDGLGTDLSLSGSGNVIPDPGPVEQVTPEPHAWMLWGLAGLAAVWAKMFQVSGKLSRQRV